MSRWRKGAKSYFYRQRIWLLMLILLFLFFCILLVYNQVPVREIMYGSVVLGFLILILTGIDLFGYCSHLMDLERNREEMLINGGRMEQSRDLMEQQYLDLCQELLREKNEMQQRQQKKETELKEYFSLWVHQIKTPMAALDLLLQEKSSQIDVEGEKKELFLIEQYLTMCLSYMRLESESTDFILKKVSLDEMIRGSIRRYARMFIQKKIALEYEGTAKQILTDEKWAGFVIEQLLSNALKYTKEGKISIQVSETEPVCLVIEDSGIGIREEDLPRVFEKGFTGYNGHSSSYSSGIGLYLCRRVADLISLSLSIESKEGEGTQVTLIFPQKR